MKNIALSVMIALVLTAAATAQQVRSSSPRFFHRIAVVSAPIQEVTADMVSKHYNASGSGACVRNSLTATPSACIPVPFQSGQSKVYWFYERQVLSTLNQFQLDSITWVAKVIPGDGSGPYCFRLNDNRNLDTSTGDLSVGTSTSGASHYYCDGF